MLRGWQCPLNVGVLGVASFRRSGKRDLTRSIEIPKKEERGGRKALKLGLAFGRGDKSFSAGDSADTPTAWQSFPHGLGNNVTHLYESLTETGLQDLE